MRFSVLRQGRVGEVLFASNMDSPRRERATTSLTPLVRCARSIKGGLDNLGYRPPEVDAKTKTKEGALWR